MKIDIFLALSAVSALAAAGPPLIPPTFTSKAVTSEAVTQEVEPLQGIQGSQNTIAGRPKAKKPPKEHTKKPKKPKKTEDRTQLPRPTSTADPRFPKTRPLPDKAPQKLRVPDSFIKYAPPQSPVIIDEIAPEIPCIATCVHTYFPEVAKMVQSEFCYEQHDQFHIWGDKVTPCFEVLCQGESSAYMTYYLHKYFCNFCGYNLIRMYKDCEDVARANNDPNRYPPPPQAQKDAPPVNPP